MSQSEKWAKGRKWAEAVAETEQTAHDTSCLHHFNSDMKTSYLTKSDRRQHTTDHLEDQTFGDYSKTNLT